MFIEWNACDIDGLEPFLDLTLRSFTLVDEEVCFEDFRLFIARDTTEILFHAVLVLHGKLIGHIATDARDSLLSVEDFECILAHRIEIYEPERVSFEYRFDNGNIAFSIRIDIVALVFRLYREAT